MVVFGLGLGPFVIARPHADVVGLKSELYTVPQIERRGELVWQLKATDSVEHGVLHRRHPLVAGAIHVCLSQHLCRGSTVSDLHGPLDVIGDGCVMCDDQHRRAAFLVNPTHRSEHFDAGCLVELSGRLVCE